jgi:starch synthase
MNVLFASAEADPFAKAGGLADVVGSLPQALRRQKVDARVVMPLHGNIDRATHHIQYLFQFQHRRHRGTANVYVHYTERDGVPFYFLETWPFFGETPALYTAVDWDTQRFIAFCELVLALAWELGQGTGGQARWFPDVLHTHDWHTGLANFLLAEARKTYGWGHVGSVITIHNMGYQADWSGPMLFDAGIPARTHPDLVWQHKTDNLLGIGIAYADVVTTVSPRYAGEIQGERFGEGLDGLVRTRASQGDLFGILNGLDMNRFDPAKDPRIDTRYTVETFREGKLANKMALQAQCGLPQRPEVPLIGVVSRLTLQKGFDIGIPALRGLLQTEDIQLVALGSGDPDLEHGLWALQNDFRGKAYAYIGYNASFSQRIYAGCDLFLMPSRYEPCGTSQMIAMRYGALPIVRETGGLADTVPNYDDRDADVGAGFVFLWETPDAVYHTTRWAINTYRNRPIPFQRMQRRAMETDFSWDRSVGEYLRVYERAAAKHR